LVILLLTAGCEISQSSVSEMQSSALAPPSSSYPADITGQVIITNHILDTSVNDTVHTTYTMVDSPRSQQQFWIIRLSIRNKNYPSPIAQSTNGTTATGWEIVSNSDPNSILDVSRFAGQTSIKISQGQTGVLIFRYVAPAGLNPNNFQIRYSGQQPVSIGKLTYKGNVVDYYDWNNQVVTNSPPTQVVGSTNPVWSHAGFIQATMIGTNYSSITFQDGFSLNFIATVGKYSPPSIGGKFEVKYYFDAQRGGNIITSLSPVP